MVKLLVDNLKMLRWYIFHWIAYVSSKIPTRKHLSFDVVIVRGDALGDYVIWHDTLSAYCRRFEGKRVLFICADLVRPLAEKEDFFSDIYAFNRHKAYVNLIYFFKILRYMRSISADIVINPVHDRHMVCDDIIYQIKSPMKIGTKYKGDWQRLKSFYDSQYQKLVECEDLVSEIRLNEQFTKDIISSEYIYGNNPLSVVSSYDGIGGDYVVLAFSSSSEYKDWEIEKFAAIIDYIPAKYKVVLTGAGHRDAEKASQIIRLIRNKSRIIDKVNKTSVVELVSLIAHASFVVGNDSAAVHIAAATRVKSVCILLGAHFGRFLPYPDELPSSDYIPKAIYKHLECYGCNYHCIYRENPPFRCIKEVSVDMVKSEIDRLVAS